MMLRLLLVGHDSQRIGGATNLFRLLVNSLRDRPDVEVKVVSSARSESRTVSPFFNMLVAIRVTFALIRHASRADVVSLHASAPGIIKFGPIAFLLTRLLGKPLVVRVFGGGLHDVYEGLPAVWKALFRRTVLTAHALLVETKYLVAYFETRGARSVHWYSNSRPMAQPEITRSRTGGSAHRFVYLGQVTKSKGIETVLNAVGLLRPGISVDVFGPIGETYSVAEIERRGEGKLRYLGALDPAEVQAHLTDYDVLVMPTEHWEEGYPGVIIEAYVSCLPVIASDLRGIREIVSDETGILIPIQSPSSLAEAMNRLASDEALFQRLREGACRSRIQFCSTHWTDRFVDICTRVKEQQHVG